MALTTATGAESEGQVIALLGPHVLTALLLIPAASPANAVELCQDAALPLIEALQVHPGAVRAVLIVAHHLLIVILLQVHWSPEAAEQGRGTWGFFKQLGPSPGMFWSEWFSSCCWVKHSRERQGRKEQKCVSKAFDTEFRM